jgi:non-ribosomal peptide synthetase component F
MNDIFSFLAKYRAKEISLSLDDSGENLKISGEIKNLLPEDKADLLKHKADLVNFLKSQLSVNERIEKVPDAPNYEISDAQRRLWVLSQFEEGSAAYNISERIFLHQEINIDDFKKAIAATIERHEILRTVFKENEEGEVRQWILGIEELNFEISYEDFRTKEKGVESLKQYINTDSLRPFDLENGPLFRAALLQVEEQAYVFYYNMHHIISDGWSMQVLSADVTAYYESFQLNHEPKLNDLRIQYKDYSAWQLAQLESDIYKVHQAYWLDALAGELPLIDLSGGEKRPRLKTHNGQVLSTFLDSHTTIRLNEFVGEHGGSVFMSLLAVWNVLIYRYTGQEDIIIGTPVAGRDHIDLENQIGFFVNTLALRNTVDSTTSFSNFYEALKNRTLESFSHQMYPFDRLVEELNLTRDTSRSAVFDVMFVLRNKQEIGEPFIVDTSIVSEGNAISKFDLEISIQEKGNHLFLEIIYNPDVYASGAVEGLMRHYGQLLTSLLENPSVKIGEANYLLTEEKQKLDEFNATEFDYPQGTLVDLIEKQAVKTPNNIAVVFEEKALTYRELNESANQLANYLRTTYEVSPESLVGIMLERSEWQMISLLGILKAGGAYVPIDSESPRERIDKILTDSKVKLLLNDSELSKFRKQQETYSIENLETILHPNNLAYVIYTSGSTGEPKGVLLEHGGIVNRLQWMVRDLNIHESDVFIQKTPLTFDVSVWELFTPLINGSKLVLVKPDGHKDPVYLESLMLKHKISIVHFVPSMLSRAIDLIRWNQLESVRHLICSG